MTRSLLLTAPWRRAWLSLRHRPGLLAAALSTGVIVGLVAAAPVLFVSSVGAGAVQVQYSRSCPASTAITLREFRPTFVDGQDPEFVDPLSFLGAAVAEDPNFAAPEQILGSATMTATAASGAEAKIGFLVRDGWHDHIDLVSPEVPGDVWLPDTLQAALGVQPGDRIQVNGADLVVAGVFRDLAAKPLDGFWCAATTAIVPANMYGEVFPPPMAIIDGIDSGPGAQFFSGRVGFSRYVVEFAAPPRTLADSSRLAAATVAFNARAKALSPYSSLTSNIDLLDVRAHTVRDAVRDTTTPVAALAVICALSLASVLGLLWVRARRNSCIALATIGVSPSSIGAKAALETALAMLVGAVAGCFLARGTVGVWAPSEHLEPGTLTTALIVSVVAALVGLLLVAITAAGACRGLLRHAPPVRRGWQRVLPFVPFELGFAVIAWVAERGLSTEALVPIEGRRVVDTSAAVLVLPLAVLALGAALTARAWWWATRRTRSRRLPTHLPRRLALRRLQFGSKAGTAILGAGTLALGVSIFGLTMNSSLERTGVAKSAVFVGSDVSVLIAGSLPPGVDGASEVWFRQAMEYDGETVDLLAVDPATFAAAAFWDDSFSDRTLPDLLTELGADDGGVRVIAVGDAPATGEVTNPKLAGEPYTAHVVARVDTFPGAGSKHPTLIMSIDAAQQGAIKFRHFVWARGTYQHWRVVLQDLGAEPVLGVTRQAAVDSSVLKFAAWSFDFVKALGIFVGALVTAALLLHLAVRQRQQALGFAFLRRMGFSHRRHWWALVLEVGAMMLAVFGLGSVLALVCVRIVGPHVDPLPAIPPSPLMVVPWAAIAVAAAIAGAVVFVGSAIAQWLGSRVDVAEVLRDGT